MAMPARIIHNPDVSIGHFFTPEGEEFGPLELADDPIVLAEDEEAGPHYVAFLEEFAGIKPGMYKLQQVAAEFKTDAELQVEEDEDEEEEEDDEVVVPD